MARSDRNRTPTKTMAPPAPATGPFWSRDHAVASLRRAADTATPALIFGLRLSASVCLALYIAFWLQLDNAYWAGASAAAVSQPSLGASLRKGWFRMVGTMAGATFIVVLTACFVQNRAAFLIGLALWGGACALVATLLRNFASYAAALAGFTAVIVASDELGTTGGATGSAFMFAVTRAGEICIGIACAGVILAATDFGGARRRLANVLATLTQQITSQFVATLTATSPRRPDTQPIRREFIRRVIALDPTIDQAIGESSQLRHNSYRLQQAVYGLIDALARWRTVASHLVRLSQDQTPRHEVGKVLQSIPYELRGAQEYGDPSHWTANPVGLLRVCQKAVRALVDVPPGTRSGQLLIDQTVKVFMGISQALRGLALLVADPGQSRHRIARSRLDVADWHPPLINASRAFLAIGTAELVWVVSGWSNGTTCIIWTAITVVVFGPRADQAYTGAMQFLLGTGLAVVFAAIVKFAVLPQLGTFVGFSVALACYLIPVGALSALSWRPAVFTSMGVNFVALLASENLASYDTAQFYNSSLGLFAGSVIAALAFRLLPPLSPPARTARLLTLTLRDLRRLARSPTSYRPGAWERHVYARISVLPDSAVPLQRAQIVAALAVGTEMIRLHRIARRLRLGTRLEPTLKALARGRSLVAAAELARFDESLAETRLAEQAERLVLHARGNVLALSEVLTQYASYFDAGVSE
jgi:uncharacterized membrane protein YccC